jgi:hydroxymethylpyrimidine pyrophosphatase-like HAD family hydrolase
VVRYEDQPFIDVYPVAPNKGRALRGILEELAIDDGVLYVGDSETDNSAFQNSNVSVGVIHSRTHSDDLESDFFVNFGDVSSFLENIVKNSFRFSPNFPNITLNPRHKRNSTKTLGEKHFLVPALRHESHS